MESEYLYYEIIVLAIVSVVFISGCVQTQEPVSPEQKKVFVITDKGEYVLEEGIVVTVKNNFDTSITTVNMQTFCDIVSLEIKEGADWKEVNNCLSKAPTHPVTLEPNSETVIRLPTKSPYEHLSAGIYRFAIVYAIGNEYWNKEHLPSYSNEFIIK